MPQEISEDNKIEEDLEEELAKKKLKLDEDEKEKNVQDYLRLGHEKLLMSCLGIGFSNLTKALI